MSGKIPGRRRDAPAKAGQRLRKTAAAPRSLDQNRSFGRAAAAAAIVEGRGELQQDSGAEVLVA